MQDLLNWEERFENCIYSDKLLNKLIELNKLVEQPVDIIEVKKAIYYARKYHGQQMRQSGEPYYSHPIAVAIMIAEFTAIDVPKLYTTTMLNAALLHDTIEDTELTKEDIITIFNNQVAQHVEGLTRIRAATGKKISIEESLNSLIEQKRYDTCLIKIFDRIHNIQTLYVKSPEKAWKIIEETISKFVTLTAYLGVSKLEQELNSLCLSHLQQNNPNLQKNELFIDNFQLPALV